MHNRSFLLLILYWYYYSTTCIYSLDENIAIAIFWHTLHFALVPRFYIMLFFIFFTHIHIAHYHMRFVHTDLAFVSCRKMVKLGQLDSGVSKLVMQILFTISSSEPFWACYLYHTLLAFTTHWYIIVISSYITKTLSFDLHGKMSSFFFLLTC